MRQVVIDPDICNGRPVLEGTRITAQSVVAFLAAGDSVEAMLAEYPSLTRDDVSSRLAYGTSSFDNETPTGPTVLVGTGTSNAYDATFSPNQFDAFVIGAASTTSVGQGMWGWFTDGQTATLMESDDNAETGWRSASSSRSGRSVRRPQL